MPEVFLAVGQKYRILAGARGFHPLQPVEMRMFQRQIKRLQPVGMVRMPRWRAVLQNIRMRVKARGHRRLAANRQQRIANLHGTRGQRYDGGLDQIARHEGQRTDERGKEGQALHDDEADNAA